MAARRQQISKQQAEFLREATASSDPSDVTIRLYRTLEGLDGEALDPRWKVLWERVKDQAYEQGAAPLNILNRLDSAVASLRFVDERLERLRIKPAEKVCFLLGAGASAPEPSSIPTVTKLLPELWKRAGKIGRDDIDKLAQWCAGHEISNIEDLLTAAYLANFAAKNSAITGLLDYFLFRSGGTEATEIRAASGRIVRRATPRVDAASIALLQDTLQVLFGLLTGTMIPARPNDGHMAIVDFLKRHANSSIVTTNYDGCIDEALIRSDLQLNTYAEDSRALISGATDLIKIHGSINWSYCESCHEVREFPLLAMKEAYETDSSSYAVIGICKNCQGQRRPLLIPPIGFKFIMFPNLIRLWNTAREKLEEADLIVVVGYSFAEADNYINKIIERSMTRNVSQQIAVFDPNPNLVSALRERFAARIDDFDRDRIMAALGSAHELLPGVLKDVSASSTAESETKGRTPRRPRTRASRESSAG